ncbi:epoxyqueuosine (oQ) reductase QueG [Lachnospiraceae bacterium KM106-2]|nr:epoxyqueuosine (oQ) reductase QueG [Lachnospiraceae bacterium KM106-2]
MRTKIEEYCRSIGLDTFGMIPCRVYEELIPFYEERKSKRLENEFEEEEIEKRINPAHYMPEAKTIISIAFPYSYGEDGTLNGFSTYTKRADYHRVVNQYLTMICGYIRSLGGKAEGFVDSNTLPERYLAYLAGVGFVGRNNMIITKKYGSYVFLGEILTDLELPCTEQRSFTQIPLHEECQDCNRCYQECPTKSINKGRANPNICLSYLTQKKEISKQEMKLLKGNIFGCDFCQLQCPYNKEAEPSPLKEFAILDFMNEEAEIYAGMDNKFFKEKINGTSCGWRGKNVIKRNAMIQMHRDGKKIAHFRGDSSYINKYIDLLEGKEDE